ncbi:MAG TPA: flagellar motor protein MotA [Cytophagales bacterium]|jgi:biopolymer transport protein ExbB|nr:flagellar motor protein MotA [Cytophagales bacterium]
MKKLFVLLMISGIVSLGFSTNSFAQTAEEGTEMAADTTAAEADTAAADVEGPAEAITEEVIEERTPDEEVTFHQAVKEKFIEGGWQFMSIVLACLILGMAVAIERIITLNLATTNTKKLLAQVDEALTKDGVEGAKEVCKSTRGPVASIFTQGLMRMSEGVEMVEKSIISYGSVEMGRLEKGLIWISLFISVAPMLGFMGTVIGMIGAFDTIEAMGDIQASAIAGNIKVALLTTVAGLIVAVILQFFYNYLVSKIDSLVNQMEDASISFIDLLVKHNLTK